MHRLGRALLLCARVSCSFSVAGRASAAEQSQITKFGDRSMTADTSFLLFHELISHETATACSEASVVFADVEALLFVHALTRAMEKARRTPLTGFNHVRFSIPYHLSQFRELTAVFIEDVVLRGNVARLLDDLGGTVVGAGCNESASLHKFARSLRLYSHMRKKLRDCRPEVGLERVRAHGSLAHAELRRGALLRLRARRARARLPVPTRSSLAQRRCDQRRRRARLAPSATSLELWIRRRVADVRGHRDLRELDTRIGRARRLARARPRTCLSRAARRPVLGG